MNLDKEYDAYIDRISSSGGSYTTEEIATMGQKWLYNRQRE